MCGLAGVAGDLHGVDTDAMLCALAHRGPDGGGEQREVNAEGAGVWLGHRRLAIIDLSASAAQPMRSASGRYWIVFNGEIYNFRQLRSSLETRGARFRGHGDTEVILALVEEWGIERTLELLRGMFAFALWDGSTGNLTLARDRLGEKPLYYAALGTRFLFASEVRALLASGVVDRQIDPDGLEAFLTFGAVADPHTIVRGVKALDAGCVVTVGREGVKTRRYWDLATVKAARAMSRDDAIQCTRAAIVEAEKRCMVADVPVAVLLSGGIDSSSNVTLLREAGHSNLMTFSVTFPGDGAGFDEAPYSRLVARVMGTEHREVAMGLSDARRLVPLAVAAMDQPTYDGVNTYIVCDAIRRAGIKVAVSGQGADELFLGYSQRRLYPWLEGAARAMRPWRGRPWAGLPGARLIPANSRFEKLLQMAGGGDASSAAYLVGYSVFSWPAIQRLRGAPIASPTRFIVTGGGETSLDRLSRLQIRNYLRNVLLRDGDQMSMAHGVELRAPFVDSDLVEAVTGIPGRFKVERGRNKPLLLDAVGPGLPREVWARRKQGFGLPYGRWIRDGLRVADLQRTTTGLRSDPARVVEARFVAGENPTRFWSLQVLAAWIERNKMGSRWISDATAEAASLHEIASDGEVPSMRRGSASRQLGGGS